MIAQKRKMYETSIVGSDRLCACSANGERAWWRLSLATDAYGTLDVTDARRLRLALFGDVVGFETVDAMELAITELIGRGLLVEWTQEWQGATRRFLHIVNHDQRQTARWLTDRKRREGRPSPVPPFDCCDHAAHCGALRGTAPQSPTAAHLRGNAAHCGALRGTAAQVEEPAWGLDAAHCGAAPSREEVIKKGTLTSASLDAAVPDWVQRLVTARQALADEERFMIAADRIGSPSARVQQPTEPVDDDERGAAAVGPHRTSAAVAARRPDRPSNGEPCGGSDSVKVKVEPTPDTSDLLDELATSTPSPQSAGLDLDLPANGDPAASGGVGGVGSGTLSKSVGAAQRAVPGDGAVHASDEPPRGSRKYDPFASSPSSAA